MGLRGRPAGARLLLGFSQEPLSSLRYARCLLTLACSLRHSQPLLVHPFPLPFSHRWPSSKNVPAGQVKS